MKHSNLSSPNLFLGRICLKKSARANVIPPLGYLSDRPPHVDAGVGASARLICLFGRLVAGGADTSQSGKFTSYRTKLLKIGSLIKSTPCALVKILFRSNVLHGVACGSKAPVFDVVVLDHSLNRCLTFVVAS